MLCNHVTLSTRHKSRILSLITKSSFLFVTGVRLGTNRTIRGVHSSFFGASYCACFVETAVDRSPNLVPGMMMTKLLEGNDSPRCILLARMNNACDETLTGTDVDDK